MESTAILRRVLIGHKLNAVYRGLGHIKSVILQWSQHLYKLHWCPAQMLSSSTYYSSKLWGNFPGSVLWHRSKNVTNITLCNSSETLINQPSSLFGGIPTHYVESKPKLGTLYKTAYWYVIHMLIYIFFSLLAFQICQLMCFLNIYKIIFLKCCELAI